MSKTVVFVTFSFVACVAIIGGVVLQIERPDASATFINLIVTVLTILGGFAATVYGLGKVNEKIETVARQTNGTLGRKEDKIEEQATEIERLRSQLGGRRHNERTE